MSFESNPIDEQPADKDEYERWERRQEIARVCQSIMDDMENDANLLEGQPFNGRTVATQFGRNMAAIKALARICKTILEEE